jgi:hypothetical protein
VRTTAPAEVWVAAALAIAIVVGAVSRLPSSRSERRWALAGLIAWVALDLLLGAFGLFAADTGRTVPGIVAGIFVPFLIGLWLLSRSSRAERLGGSPALERLIGCQVYRLAGAVFLLAWARGVLPAAFAIPAGIGDICVGGSAPLVASRVARERDGWHRLAVGWNIAGLADLAMAITLGALTSPSTFHPATLGSPGYLTSRLPLVLVPVFAVPLSALLHVVTLRRLRAVPTTRQRGWRTIPT